MKPFTILLVFLFMVCTSYISLAQIEFQRTYGGPLINEGRSVQQTLDGGYIIAGSTSSFGYGETDVLLIKTDSNGNAQFMKTYGGPNIDHGYSVLQLSDSGYVVAGYTNSFGNGGYDAYLVRTDKNGDTLWTKTYGGADWDFIYSCKQTSDGGFVMAGNTYSYGNGNSNGWIIKTDSNGDTLWTKVFFTNDDSFFSSIDNGFNNSYIATGYETNELGDTNNIIAADISSSGDSLWFYIYEDSLNIQARVIHSISDTTYIIGGCIFIDSMQTNVFLMKIDTNGNKLWFNNTVTTNTGFNDLFDFVALPNDNLVLASTNTEYGGGGVDIFQEFTDSIGNYIHAPTHGGAGTDFAYSISRTSDNGFIMAGESNSWGPGLEAVFLVKTDSNGVAPDTTTVGLSEVLNNYFEINIYPNPCKDFCFIRFPEQVYYSEDLSLSVFDVLGKKVFSKNVVLGNTIELNTSAFATGVYFIELKSGVETIGNEKLLIE